VHLSETRIPVLWVYRMTRRVQQLFAWLAESWPSTIRFLLLLPTALERLRNKYRLPPTVYKQDV